MKRIPTAATSAMPTFKQGLPATLAFIAGFVDACSFLAFAGFFVAQATGSFVVAGAELFTETAGFTIKVLALPVFVGAGMLTTCIVRAARGRERQAMAGVVGIEALLLTGIIIYGQTGMKNGLTVPPALVGLAAMGIQSAAARLLLSGYGSTNVMTTNTTQLSIDLTDSLLTRRLVPNLLQTGTIMLGFLIGVILGSLAFNALGLECLLLPVVVLILIALVQLRQPTSFHQFS